jgi:hypothetical protein
MDCHVAARLAMTVSQFVMPDAIRHPCMLLKLVIWSLSPLGMSLCLAALALLLAWLPDALALDLSGRAMKEIAGKWVGW